MIVLDIDRDIKPEQKITFTDEWRASLIRLIDDANANGLSGVVTQKFWFENCPETLLHHLNTCKTGYDAIDYMANLFNDGLPEKLSGILTKMCDSAKLIALKKVELRAKMEEELKDRETPEFRAHVQTLLLSRQRNEAIFQISQKLLDKEHIHTIRDDEKEEVWMYNDGIYEPNAKCFIREYCKLICGAGYQKTISNEVIAHIVASTYINADIFFAVQNVDEICVKNGVLNIRTRELKPFSPEYRFFSKINAEYHKDAPENVKLKEFIKSVVSKEDGEIIQELFGYLLYKKYPIQKAFMFTGMGSNGKSRILELVKYFIGAENCIDIDLQKLEENDFLVSELFQKSACLGADLSSEDLKNTSTFRKLTGEDLITANRKYKTSVSFVNFGKLIFNANIMPRPRTDTRAFFRRWIIIEFLNLFAAAEEISKMPENEQKKVTIADPEIVQKIATIAGLNSLLLWALDGLDRLLKNMHFSHSKTTEEIRNTYLLRCDSFNVFAERFIEENASNFIVKGELKKLYIEFCKNSTVTPMSDVVISKILRDRYFPQSVRQTAEVDGFQKLVNCWVGVGWKLSLKEIHTQISGVS